MGVGEARPLRRHQEGAPQGDLQATCDRDPVDRPDDRLVDHRQEAEQAVGVALGALAGRAGLGRRRRLAGRLLQVDAGAEGGVGSGEDDRVHAGIRAEPDDRIPRGRR
jgi:hypothetical protein